MLTAIVSMMMASVAATMGFTAVFLPQVRNISDPLYMDNSTGSWYASINNLASPFGSLTAGFVMDRFGRRTSILLPLIPIILLWALNALAESLTVLFLCRTLIGFFIGFVPVTCQVQLHTTYLGYINAMHALYNMQYNSLTNSNNSTTL